MALTRRRAGAASTWVVWPWVVALLSARGTAAFKQAGQAAVALLGDIADIQSLLANGHTASAQAVHGAPAPPLSNESNGEAEGHNSPTNAIKGGNSTQAAGAAPGSRRHSLEEQVGGSTGVIIWVSVIVLPILLLGFLLWYRNRMNKVNAIPDETDELAEVWVNVHGPSSKMSDLSG
mmetsp:Transcript_106121/g.331019  ORF Transcript_106121/g.331019 Transcript_106121/m.331019 type:complete len:177 (+) Transcript_106121:63-593(+)